MRLMPLSEVKTRLSQLVDAVERWDEEVTITRAASRLLLLSAKMRTRVGKRP